MLNLVRFLALGAATTIAIQVVMVFITFYNTTPFILLFLLCSSGIAWSAYVWVRLIKEIARE